MARIPEHDPVEFLVERQFHDYRKLMASSSAITTRGPYSGNTNVDREKQLKEIEEYRAELKAKPHEEFQALHRQEIAKDQKERDAKHEKEEQERFFNRPCANADFEHWSKASYWTLDEAISLSFGKEPGVVTWDKLMNFIIYPPSPFIEQYKKLRDLVIRAHNFKQLTDPIFPARFLAWAKICDIDIPHELIKQVEKRGDVIRQPLDAVTKADERYTPITARREARKLKTQAMYESWQKEYRKLKKANPNKSDKWCSMQIAKMDIAQERDAETIRKNMKK